MKRIAIGAVVLLSLIISGLFAAGLRLAPLHVRDFDPKAAVEAAEAYSAEITRDEWGVPRVIGETDADAAFAIAWAHAEDDFATIQDSLRAGLGAEMLAKNESEARTAYIVQLLRVREDVASQYETLTPEVRAVLQGYADGLNFYAAHHRDEAEPDLFPLTGEDIAALSGFFSPLFYGLGDVLSSLAAPEVEDDPSRGQELQVMLQRGPATELGSNAFAVAASKSDDGAVRAIINSHQPVDGALAWYEGHLISGEGLNVAGGLFPGAPAIHLGVNPGLAQAATVNRPDLIDVYALVREGDGYRLDGEARDFDTRTASMTVRLFGPFAWRVTRDAHWSQHGPVLETDAGAYAIRYATMGDIRFIEQAYAMMRAETLEAFEAALLMGGMGNTNRIVATREGRIARYYLARMPDRPDIEGIDWSTTLPGDRSDLIWEGFAPFDALPHMIDPEAGYVLDANHSPFNVTGGPDDPDAAAFPARFGIETNMTNRGLRAVALMAAQDTVSREELLAVKYDPVYAPESFAGRIQARIAQMDWDEDLRPTADAVARWDRGTELSDTEAALSIITALSLYADETDAGAVSDADIRDALAGAAALLTTHHGRIDPPWREVNFLQRGETQVALAGGPDTLRAVNSVIDEETGTLRMVSGDGLHMLAEWAPGADYPDVFAVHQFGASNAPDSTHYDDQMDLFARQELRRVPLREADVRAAAVRVYRPGEAHQDAASR
ncbi:MAG: penicillin acylase family protein [Oceanicaulis sp.]